MRPSRPTSTRSCKAGDEFCQCPSGGPGAPELGHLPSLMQQLSVKNCQRGDRKGSQAREFGSVCSAGSVLVGKA